MEEDIKARQDKLHANWAKVDADREKRRADMKAFNELMEGREAERRAYQEMTAEWETDRKRPTSRRGWPREKQSEKEWRQGLEAINDKRGTTQMKFETETEHQGKMDANLKKIKEDIKTNGPS
jgi:hypothetical protein